MISSGVSVFLRPRPFLLVVLDTVLSGERICFAAGVDLFRVAPFTGLDLDRPFPLLTSTPAPIAKSQSSGSSPSTKWPKVLRLLGLGLAPGVTARFRDFVGIGVPNNFLG